jgi:hypothetical protein
MTRQIILPRELADEKLKELGVDGYIDPTTGLLLPYSAESERIIRERLEDLHTARAVHASDNPATKDRRPTKENMV